MIKIYCYWSPNPSGFSGELANLCTWNLDYKYRDLFICKNLDEADYIICNGEPYYKEPKKCIIFYAEPPVYRKLFYNFDYLDKGKYFYVFDKHAANFHWHGVNTPLKELYELRPPKTDKLVSFCSNKYPSESSQYKYLGGYIDRIEFVVNNLDTIDFINYEQYGQLDYDSFPIFIKQGNRLRATKHYNGEADSKDKLLSKSKYIFDSENSYYENYFTEKILTPLFYNCYVFYNGHSSIKNHLDLRFYKLLNLSSTLDRIESLEAIKEIIASNYYDTIKDELFEYKRKLLIQYNPLEIVWNILVEKGVI